MLKRIFLLTVALGLMGQGNGAQQQPHRGVRVLPLPPTSPSIPIQKPQSPRSPSPSSRPPMHSPPPIPAAHAGELPGSLMKTSEGRICRTPPKRKVRILVIDGGGIRGIIPSVVVEALERELGLPIAKIMDAFGGTSVGGIMSLGYNKPKVLKNGMVVGDEPAYSAESMKDINAELGIEIFKEKGKLINILTTGSLYTKTALEERLDRFFGDTRVSQTLKPVYLTSFDLNSEGTFIISTSLAKLGQTRTAKKPSDDQPHAKLIPHPGGHDGEIDFPTNVTKNPWPFDFKMTEAARATSAAPFYFPIMSYELVPQSGIAMQLIDGGIGNNNPSATIVAEIDKEYCTPPAIFVLSLGTGVSKAHFKDIDLSKRGGPLRMASPLLTGFFKAQEEISKETMKEYVGIRNAFLPDKSKYIRMQVFLEQGQDVLDNASPESVQLFKQKGEELVKSAEFKEAIATLREELCNELAYCREETKIGREGYHKKMCPHSPSMCRAK